MARPRSFDLDAALDDALNVFWARGYEATSICDLKEAIGIETGSLYKAFGSKKELYEKALRRYLDRGLEFQREHVFSSDDVWQAMAQVLDSAAVMATEGDRRGCFAINCAVDAAPHDPDVLEILKNHDRNIMRLFTERLAEGQAAGSVTKAEPAKDLARFVFATIGGLQVQGRSGVSRASLRATARLAAGALAP
ncbi:MAG: TetR/AcrR family transcriptional regulator [Planctomycetota bacterium]